MGDSSQPISLVKQVILVSAVILPTQACIHGDRYTLMHNPCRCVDSGVERFKVIKVLEERPVLMALVEVLQEEEDEGEVVCSDTAPIFHECSASLAYLYGPASVL